MELFKQIMVDDVLPFLIAVAIGALIKILADPRISALADKFAQMLASQTQSFAAASDKSNNALLREVIHAAMSYAENNQAQVLSIADSKMDYVIATVQADPRIAKLNLPLSGIKHLIEQIWSMYFADLNKPEVKTAPAPVVANQSVSDFDKLSKSL